MLFIILNQVTKYSGLISPIDLFYFGFFQTTHYYYSKNILHHIFIIYQLRQSRIKLRSFSDILGIQGLTRAFGTKNVTQ